MLLYDFLHVSWLVRFFSQIYKCSQLVDTVTHHEENVTMFC
jgi:hypothetical protein